ncbi:hypothetical protein CFC21_005650 [Triticum aestivum]|uniref:Auxin-responsive protein n=3 Tax=Triticum TaxID=4564 RepID=A0A9R0V4J1_TRITD|nr:auxin-responsive protein IAA8-like isoform X2 [Triticum dicoccoides]XP_044365922.1 auxin-responsive protein IAA8-like isoform X2 [Triticum aestivum]KAF6988064.1 hypothetical protein CFC21_005650 [Triticum aestivum]VAH14085.1 unnamed protein product [Triticum turgidum subsp. durum]
MECKAAREPSSSAPSSSMDSCGAGGPRATVSTASSFYRPAIDRGLSTDLHLGLSLRSCSSSFHAADGVSASTPRSALTTTAGPAYETGGGGGSHGQQLLFVKVYMEGVPIGRKLDLLLLDGYDDLLAILGRMFKASIIHPDTIGRDHRVVLGEKQARHVVTYQDQEGDWLMAGDLPWALFLASVKKLKIARVDSSISD